MPVRFPFPWRNTVSNFTFVNGMSVILFSVKGNGISINLPGKKSLKEEKIWEWRHELSHS